MNRIKLLFIGVLLLNISIVFGQTKSDSIQIKKGFGTTYLQYNQKLKPKDVIEITESCTDSWQESHKAKIYRGFGNVFGFAGGFMFGWELGMASGGYDFNPAVLGIGAGLVLISIPFDIAYSSHIKKAVHIYNDRLKKLGITKIDYNIGMSRNGLGIKMRF